MNRRWRATEVGTSLVELVVVVGLLGILLPTAFGVVISMQRQASITTDRFSALSEAQVIADRITKDLRAAVAPNPTSAPFVSADARAVTFYASLADPNGPTKLNAYIATISGTNVAAFHEDQTRADAGSAPNHTFTGAVQPRIQGKYIDTVTPIFTFYDRNGVLLATPITLTPSLRAIESVGITLTARVTPTAPATTITTRVHIRNVDYNPS